MSWDPLDLAKDLAVARAGENPADPERTMRRRIAALLSIPALVVAAAVGSAIPSWIAGVATAILLLGGLWILGDGWPRWARRGKTP